MARTPRSSGAPTRRRARAGSSGRPGSAPCRRSGGRARPRRDRARHGGPHPGSVLADVRRTAAPDALQRAERHGQRPIARKPDDLARHHRSALDPDVETSPELHRRDRPGDLDQKPTDGRDPSVDLVIIDPRQGRTGGGQPALRGSAIMVSVNLSFTARLNTGAAGREAFAQGASRKSRLRAFLNLQSEAKRCPRILTASEFSTDPSRFRRSSLARVNHPLLTSPG